MSWLHASRIRTRSFARDFVRRAASRPRCCRRRSLFRGGFRPHPSAPPCSQSRANQAELAARSAAAGMTRDALCQVRRGARSLYGRLMPTPLWFSQLHASGQRRLTVRPPLFAKHCVTPPSTTRQLIYRLAIPGGMLCLFAALAALWVFGFQPEYFGALRLLGIEPYRFPFLDIHGVLAAAECHWQGIDVYLSNPCDVENRIQTYSPLWLVLIPRSW